MAVAAAAPLATPTTIARSCVYPSCYKQWGSHMTASYHAVDDADYGAVCATQCRCFLHTGANAKQLQAAIRALHAHAHYSPLLEGHCICTLCRQPLLLLAALPSLPSIPCATQPLLFTPVLPRFP